MHSRTTWNVNLDEEEIRRDPLVPAPREPEKAKGGAIDCLSALEICQVRIEGDNRVSEI